MLRDGNRHDNDGLVAESEEGRIRADERARVEDELRTWEDEDRADRDPNVVDAPVSDRVAPARRDSGRLDTDRAEAIEDVRDRDNRLVIEPDQPVEVVRVRTFSIGQVLALLTGAGLIALGVVALVQTGVDTPLSEPVEPVMGWDHTPWLGIFEIAAGALLVLFSLRPGGRWLVALVGAALIAGGVLILGEIDWTVDELKAEESFGWVPIVAGGIAILAALLTPRRYQRVTGTPVVA